MHTKCFNALTGIQATTIYSMIQQSRKATVYHSGRHVPVRDVVCREIKTTTVTQMRDVHIRDKIIRDCILLGSSLTVGMFSSRIVSCLHHNSTAKLEVVGISHRIPILWFSDSYRTKKKNNRNIGLAKLSDFKYRTSKTGLPIAIGLAERYRTKKSDFHIFLNIFSQNFAVLMSFWEFLQKPASYWLQYCFWHLCCSWLCCCCLRHCCWLHVC